jgi:hypothetical protein
MSEFKGTKGEWNIFQQDDDIHIENECNSEAIATLVGWNNDKIGIANAKLIACAPEMLEMLEDILSGMKNENYEVCQSEIEQLIKKATS